MIFFNKISRKVKKEDPPIFGKFVEESGHLRSTFRRYLFKIKQTV